MTTITTKGDIMHQGLQQMLTKLGRPSRPAAVVAHRGNSADAPENTLAAFQSAIDLGADVIEFDIHLSRDNQIVVMHDDDVSRCSDGAGLIRAMDLAALRALDAGAWFGPGFAGQRVPQLREALTLMRGRVLPCLEIKVDRQGYDPRLEDILLAELDQLGMRREVIFSSFNGRVLKRLHERDAQLWLASIGPNNAVFVPQWVQGIHPRFSEVDAEYVHAVNADGHWVGVWTVDDQGCMQKMLRAGADMVMTNRPAMMLRLLDEWAQAGIR